MKIEVIDSSYSVNWIQQDFALFVYNYFIVMFNFVYLKFWLVLSEGIKRIPLKNNHNSGVTACGGLQLPH